MKQLSSNSSGTHQYLASGFIEDDDQDQINEVTRKRKRSSSPQKCNSPTETRSSINHLLDRVPKVDELFNVTKKIGEGTFSSVYLASLKKLPGLDKKFALKHITPTSHPDRIAFELNCLQTIGGVDNVMGTKLCLRNKDHVVMVMPYFKHDRFQDYVQEVKIDEIRDYMLNLMLSLRRVHAFNIIHRDVKPSNFLYNRKQKRFALVDFGLAHVVPSLAVMKEVQDGSPSLMKSTGPSHISPNKRRARRTMSYSENQVKRNVQRRQSVPAPNNARLTERNLNTFNQRITSSRQEQVHKRRELRVFKSPKCGYQTHTLSAKSAKCKQDVRCHSRKLSNFSATGQCPCFGTPNTCNTCMSRSVQVAPRAGTPGFRPPEVLMKCQNQTTAVDIWSAGVIFLSLLSGRYPFFRAPDDMLSLAQIISIMGTEKMKKAASTYGKTLLCSPTLPALDLKTLCKQLKNGKKLFSEAKKEKVEPQSKKVSPNSNASLNSRKASTSNQKASPNTRKASTSNQKASPNTRKASTSNQKVSPNNRKVSPISRNRKTSPRLRSHVAADESSQNSTCEDVPESAYHLLYRLLDLNPVTRITAEEALRHPFLL